MARARCGRGRGTGPIIRALWERDIHTTQSCQGDDEEKAYITFTDTSAATRFLSAVTKKGERSRGNRVRTLNARMFGLLCFAPEDDVPDDLIWEYAAAPHRLEDDKDGRAAYVFEMSVSFPASDIAAIRQRLGVT